VNRKSDAGNPYSVEISRNVEDRHWDEFVARCPGGHPEQTSLWGQVKAFYGWRPVRGVISRNGGVAGGFQLLTRSFKWGAKIGYVSRGPLAISDDPRLLETIASELDQLAKKEGVVYLAVVPSYVGQAFSHIALKRGFMLKPDFIPPTGLTTATLILDLSQGLEQIWSQVRRDLRRFIRVGYRQGITVRQGSEDDVEQFRRLMWALCKRRGTTPMPPQRDFFKNLWRAFHPDGYVKLFFSEFEKKPVAGGLLFTMGDTARFWKTGWAGDHVKRNPSPVLWWEMIKWAKGNGYRYFDIVQIDAGHAKSILRGEPIPATKEYGMTFFKTSFGGQVTLLPEPLCKIYNPVLRFLVKRWGGQISRLKFIRRMVSMPL
jgi:lipid II:glycine glycyltransferase (peptidoglycan interpeptide bridge formation enzyme)